MPEQQCREVDEDSSCDLKAKGSNGDSLGPSRSIERNFATAHPSYLKTLGQAHSSWIFGAIAELVDNSRDAKATKYAYMVLSCSFFVEIICIFQDL